MVYYGIITDASTIGIYVNKGKDLTL